MEKIITYENLRSFTYSNDKICKKPIKGIVLYYLGLGNGSIFDKDTTEGEFFAEKGIIYLVPYNNPWAWMNRQAVNYTDEIVDVIIREYNLADDVPIVSSGYSMGGMSALVYSKYSKRTPVACITNCPVCDMVYHYSERPDLPRTIYSSVFNEVGSLKDALKRISPLCLASDMPDISYHIFHCDNDEMVNIQKHSQRFVDEMRKNGKKIEFTIVAGRGHCDLTDDVRTEFKNLCVEAIENV